MSFPNIKKHILSPSWTRPDWVLLLLVAVLATAFYYTYMPAAQWLHADTAIDRGYLARQDGRGLFYALDEEHSRLVCFDGDANILFSIENPSDEISGGLYIDDFAISDEGIFLSVSEWNEMNLAREAILLYDNRGRFVRTVTNRDYSDFATNKHRFQALEAKGDSVRFIECMADEILAGERHIPYPNAFNAVADAVYDGETLYVLDKTGIIYSISEQDNDRHVVYAKDQARETDCVPYRMCVDRKGQLFFTDIRNRTVRKVDRTAGNSVDVIQKTGSLTVQPAEDGSSYLLMDEEGLVVQNGNQTKTYRILHKDMSAIFRQGLCVTLSFLLLVLLFAGLLRLVFVLAHQKYTAAKLSSLISIAMVSVVAVLLCAMMMRSFRTIYREKIMEQIKSSAYTVSNQIAGTGLGEFRERIRFGQKGYNELIAVMERSFPSDIDFFRQVYCNIIALDEQGKGYALCYLDQSIGDYYPLDEDETAKLSEVYDKKTAIWNQSATDVSGTYLSVKVPVFGRDGEVTGAVDVGAETYIIDDILNAIILKIFMSIVIILMLVWVFSSEIMAYVSNLSMYRRNQKEEGSRAFPGHLVRVLIFSVFGAYNMVSTFLPVFLIRRTDIFPSHLRDLAGAVPITVNIFIIGIMSLFSAELIGRFGIRKILMAATVSSLSGNALIFILPSYASIALGLVLDGIGVGLITNALYVLITYIKDPVSRTWGLTIYNGAVRPVAAGESD